MGVKQTRKRARPFTKTLGLEQARRERRRAFGGRSVFLRPLEPADGVEEEGAERDRLVRSDKVYEKNTAKYSAKHDHSKRQRRSRDLPKGVWYRIGGDSSPRDFQAATIPLTWISVNGGRSRFKFVQNVQTADYNGKYISKEGVVGGGGGR